MTADKFNQLLDELESNGLQILKDRTATYAVENDVLHNFRRGSEIDGSTMAQTAWHYAKKHMVSLLDMIQSNDFSNRENLKEKCTDIINYIRLIWCIANEEECNKYSENTEHWHDGCHGCVYVDAEYDNKHPCIDCKQYYALGTDEYNQAKDMYFPENNT